MIDDGELWIGSRSCRYEGLADIVLYGNREDMTENHHVGTKYLWVASDGVLELHGKEKHSWTHLNEHIFKDSIPAESHEFKQVFGSQTFLGNRLIIHVLSAEGDLKEISTVNNGGNLDTAQAFLDSFNDNEVSMD